MCDVRYLYLLRAVYSNFCPLFSSCGDREKMEKDGFILFPLSAMDLGSAHSPENLESDPGSRISSPHTVTRHTVTQIQQEVRTCLYVWDVRMNLCITVTTYLTEKR